MEKLAALAVQNRQSLKLFVAWDSVLAEVGS